MPSLAHSEQVCRVVLESTLLLSDKSAEWNHFITKSKYTCAGVKLFLDVGQSSPAQRDRACGSPYCPCSLVPDVETDSAKLSSVMGFEFKPKLKR